MLKIFILITVLLSFNSFAQEKAEFNEKNYQELIKFCEQTFADEIALVHKNEVLKHWKNPNCDKILYNTASMVKSWTGIVIGIMIDKGLIESVDSPVCNYLPEWKKGCENNITIKQLVSMSAGFNRRSGTLGILDEQNMHEYAINAIPDTLPNIRFGYSNVSVQILGNIIEKVTGKNANDYYKEVLFEPLGMDSTNLGVDPSENYIVFGGAITTITDAMMVGKLMMNDGMHDGKQIVSKQWIKDSITPSENASFYGYLWWIDNNSKNRSYAAMGDGGQLTIIFPDLELMFLRRQSCNKDKGNFARFMGPKFLEMITAGISK